MCELPDVYHERNPVARKEHKCCECRGTIFAKEPYHVFSGVWDGTWRSYKTCTECDKLRMHFIHEREPNDTPVQFQSLYAEIFEGERSAEALVRMSIFMETRKRRKAPLSNKEWMETAYKEAMTQRRR